MCPLQVAHGDTHRLFRAPGTYRSTEHNAHNHPSGDPTPSGEDRALSDRLRQAGELLGVTLLDFVIVTDPAEGVRYHSFRESGELS